MQVPRLRLFEVLVIRALRLVAGWDPAATSLGAALAGALASFAFLLATGGVGSQPASAALVAVGSAGLGASVGLKAPTLAGRYLRRRELSGALGESWRKLTRDLLKIDDLPELADDPRHQRLIEAYADAFAHFDIDPRYAKERMLEAIELSRELLDGNLGRKRSPAPAVRREGGKALETGDGQTDDLRRQTHGKRRERSTT